MYTKPVVEMNIAKIIEKFIQNKSADNDDVGNYIIKRVAKKIVKPLTLIFNVSISTGVVPNKLKIAKIIPIYKKARYRNIFELPPSVTFTRFFKDSKKTCI